MSFISEDDFKKEGLNLAPMIDFLFLVLMFFASLAISRVTTKDTEISLVELQPETYNSITTADSNEKMINISINSRGEYKWITEMRDYEIKSPQEITNELQKQYSQGLFAEDKSKTMVMLKIDKNTTWEPILKAIFAIRDAGFEARPIYQPESENHPSS